MGLAHATRLTPDTHVQPTKEDLLMLNEHTLDNCAACAWTAWSAPSRSKPRAPPPPPELRRALTLLVAARGRLARRPTRATAAQGRQAQGQLGLVEDINWRASRGSTRPRHHAGGGDWLRHARNLLITGATGSGKTWLACALAHQAARSGFSVLYVRAARLFDELQVAHGDGSSRGGLPTLAKLDLLVIDDFRDLAHGSGRAQRLLELLDDRIGTRSTLITSQLPVKAWHTYLNDPTLADAILDRIVHSKPQDRTQGTRSMRDAEAAAAT